MRIDFFDAVTGFPDWIEYSDVYSHPAYGLASEFIDGGGFEVAASPETGVSFSYIKRPIGNSGLYDLITPYGYGGLSVPLQASPSAPAEFRQSFLRRSEERGLVAEFLRLSPLLENHELISTTDSVEYRTTLGSRISDYDIEFSNTSTAHRSAVRKAHRNGVIVTESDPADLLDENSSFRTIYFENMRRLDARSNLLMPQAYYEALSELPDESIHLVTATIDGVALASALFLVWQDRVHYHLSSANEMGRRLQATNAMIDFAARELGPTPRVLHLGGGLSEGDALEKFKTRASSTRFEMALCKKVVNRTAYSELSSDMPASDFFPLYRQPTESP